MQLKTLTALLAAATLFGCGGGTGHEAMNQDGAGAPAQQAGVNPSEGKAPADISESSTRSLSAPGNSARFVAEAGSENFTALSGGQSAITIDQLTNYLMDYKHPIELRLLAGTLKQNYNSFALDYAWTGYQYAYVITKARLDDIAAGWNYYSIVIDGVRGKELIANFIMVNYADILMGIANYDGHPEYVTKTEIATLVTSQQYYICRNGAWYLEYIPFEGLLALAAVYDNYDKFASTSSSYYGYVTKMSLHEIATPLACR